MLRKKKKKKSDQEYRDLLKGIFLCVKDPKLFCVSDAYKMYGKYHKRWKDDFDIFRRWIVKRYSEPVSLIHLPDIRNTQEYSFILELVPYEWVKERREIDRLESISKKYSL